MPYGIFDAALYEERGGYPLPPPLPAPERRSHVGTVIAAIEGALLVAVIVLIAVMSDRASTLAEDSFTDGRYAPCGVVTEQGVTEHLDAYAARCHSATDTDPCWAPSGVYCGPGQIQEDDPRWNCQTMGNRICGPTTTNP